MTKLQITLLAPFIQKCCSLKHMPVTDWGSPPTAQMHANFPFTTCSTISSVLNGSVAIAWSDVVQPYVKFTEAKATTVNKIMGKDELAVQSVATGHPFSFRFKVQSKKEMVSSL